MNAHRWFSPIFAATVAVPILADCGDGATCDAVCDNVLDLCTDDEFSDLARNDCLEQCAQRSSAVPNNCTLEREDVLSCLASAESLDCLDPQQSAACTVENDTLNKCISPSNGGGGGGGSEGNGGNSNGGGAPNGQSCDDDEECASDVCSWDTETCMAPGEIGAACSRDEECIDDLCSWGSETCIVPAALGQACARDEECVDDLCNWSTEICSTPGAAGAPCGRDEECLSNSCPNDTCAG